MTGGRGLLPRLVTSLAAAGAVHAGMVGFRGDGTGVFPAECQPPAGLGAGKRDGFAYDKGSYGWHPPSAAPFADGNRLFVRTIDALYGFGDPQEPFVPSRSVDAGPWRKGGSIP